MKFIRKRKIFENLSQAKSILNKKIDGFERLKDILKDNLGFMGKFSEYFLNENVPIKDLEETFEQLVELKNKNIKINIQNLNFEQLLDEIQNRKNDLQISKLVKEFPGQQKRIAKQLLKNLDKYNLFLKVSKKDFQPFINKISKYKNEEELYQALKIFSKDSLNDRKKIIEYAKNNDGANIKFKNDDILIIHVNYKSLKDLASDTSWCILNEHTFKNTYSGYQFILYDFRKDEYKADFKIGFTIKNYNMSAAHNILDKSRMKEVSNILEEYNISIESLIPKAEVLDIDPDFDIDSIKKSTKIKTLKGMANVIQKDRIEKFVKRVLTVGNINQKGVIETLVIALNKYFSDQSFVTIKDLIDLDERLKNVRFGRSEVPLLKNKYYDLKKRIDINNKYLIPYLDKIPDEIFLRKFALSRYHFFGYKSVLEKDWEKDSRFSKEQIKMVVDKMDKTIENLKIDPKNEYRLFVTTWIILKIVLNEEKDVSQYYSFLTSNNRIFVSNFVNIPIEIERLDYKDLAELDSYMKNIVKKDYNDLYLNVDYYRKTEPLIKENLIKLTDEHLKNNKLNIKVNKSTYRDLKEIFKNEIESESESNISIVQILKEFNKGKIVRKKTVKSSSDDRVSIKVI